MCIVLMPTRRSPRVERPGIGEASGWLAGASLITLIVLLRERLAAWGVMWLLALTIFGTFKALSLLHLPRAERAALGLWRTLAYLFLWPGMRPRIFLLEGDESPSKPATLWRSAALNLAAGATLLLVALWALPTETPKLVRAWTAMTGFVLLFHFGVFDLLAAAWRVAGVPAEKLFDCPVCATSLAQFWGRRWNHVFSDFARAVLFRPLARRAGVVLATLAVFVLSGVAHELVITVPAGAGYGGPLLYFVIQGVLVVAESRPALGKLLRDKPLFGWCWTAAALLVPLPLLFPPAFLDDVVLPFFAMLSGEG